MPYPRASMYVDHLRRNAEAWGVADHVLGVRVGVPDIEFADHSFDAAYSTTAFEMIRGLKGREEYRRCLGEVLRVLKSGALFGLAEPMHQEGPPDLAPLVAAGVLPFEKCLTTPAETALDFQAAGFEVLEADHAPDARV